MKIPVISTGIVNNVNFLYRLIFSVDYPTEEFIIFNNNGRDQITKELDDLTKISHPFIDKIKVCHLPHNIGVPAFWNLTIKSYITSPYWIIVNSDFAFVPGFLSKMIEESQKPEIGMVHCSNDGDGIGIGSFVCFLIKDWVIQKIGLFDENFYPAYVEDLDYFLRILLNGEITRSFLDYPYYHGSELGKGSSESYALGGSQVIKTEPHLKRRIDKARQANEEIYMLNKWGPGWRTCDTYKIPFDGKKQLEYDLYFNRSKYLGF